MAEQNNQTEQNDSLLESMIQSNKEKDQTIAEMQKKLAERDKLIQQYMMSPSPNGSFDDEENDEPFTANDVNRVVELVIKKRT